MMVYFVRPEMLYLLLIIPVLIAVHFFSLLNFKRRAFRFANFETIKRISDKKQAFSKKMGILILRVLFFFMLIFAIAGIGLDINQKGVSDEIVFALDVSGSMFAEDVAPNRLQASKKVMGDYITNVTAGSKIGVITFTSVAYLEADMTYDKLELLSKIADIDVRKTTGTSLGNALSFASSLFEREENSKSIVLITDGQENFLSNEELKDVVAHITDEGINIFILGVGSEVGGSFRNDIGGRSVINENSIKTIAETNNGVYAISDNIKQMARNLNEFFTETPLKRKFDLSFILYIVCLIMIMFEWYFINYFSRTFP